MKIREISIGDRKVFVIDDIVSKEEIVWFYNHVMSLSFQKNEVDDEIDEYPIWSIDIEPMKFFKESYITKSITNILTNSQIAKELGFNEDYILYRANINLSNYGDVEFPHFDCKPEDQDITALYYVNKEWDYKWGGETLFYLNKDPQIAILPKPGRLVLFPGNIEHLGGTPSRICKLSRLSLAMKYSCVRSTSYF